MQIEAAVQRNACSVILSSVADGRFQHVTCDTKLLVCTGVYFGTFCQSVSVLMFEG